MHMKKIILLSLLLFIFLSAYSASWIGISSTVPSPVKTQLVSSTIDRSTVHFTLDGFLLNPVETPRGSAYTVSITKGTPIQENGTPDLPKLAVSLIIPDLAKMEIHIVSSSYKDFTNLEIAPSKGIILRNTDPSSVPFLYGKSYNESDFWPGKLADSRTPHILRDLRGQTFLVYPFQYNPVTKTLRVYYDLTIEVVKAGDNGVNPLVRKENNIHVTNEFSSIYMRHFLNMGVVSYTPVNDYGRMLVICYGPFMDAMKPYVNWKNESGYPTKLVDVASIGTTSAAIKNYISAYYASNGLAFVLLVGDAPQIPTNQGTDVGGPSDNAYGYLAGNDHYADVFVGRFSAENVAQVQTQVTRTINYEKNPQFITDDWYKTVLGIASALGPGDDNEYDYQHIRNQQTELLAYTYSVNPELFDGSQGGNDAPGDPTPEMVSTEVNNGTGLILYCGHGAQNSWGTSGFSSTNVSALTNAGKLPFIWSVACVNGDFVDGTCFAEAWLRASQGGQPTGAMAFLGSTINQSWNSPMCGQDEMTDILRESYPNNIRRTFAGISINGCMKMIDEYGTDGENMADTWTVFGDPTLQVRTSLPGSLVVTHDATISAGSTSLHVTCDVDGARVTASLRDSLQGTGIVVNHAVDLTFPALTNPGDSLHLVVTAYNFLPTITDIPIITPNGPFVMYTSNHVNDTTGNQDHLADYDEDILLTLYMKNIGVAASGQLTVKLRSADNYITLHDTTDNYGIIVPGQVKSVVDGYSLHVSSTIPDEHPISFSVVASDGNATWTSNFSIAGHAPVLAYNMVVVNDSLGNNNGRLDPGETVYLKVFIRNNGSSGAANVVASLIGFNPYITIVDNQKTYGNLDGNSGGWNTYMIRVDSLCPQGQSAPFMLEITADKGITGAGNFRLTIGQVPVLIIDLDGNQSSGPVLRTAVQDLGILANYTNNINPDSLNQYASIFVCLGIFPDNTALSSIQGQYLASYLNQGGRLYMEGGDTWYFDTQTPVHPMFHIIALEDGSGDLTTLSGQAGTFTDGMSFAYNGENQYIDRISPGNLAFILFKNQTPDYNPAIAYDAGTYKTIGTSFEFAGLEDAAFPSTKDNLMQGYLDFFGIHPLALSANFVGYPTSITPGGTVSFMDFSSGAVTSYNWNFPGGTPSSSTEANPSVIYNTPGNYDVSLIVTNNSGSNTLVRNDYIHVDYPTSVEEHSGLNCSIFPNPCDGIIHLNLTSLKNDGVSVTVYNVQGKLVYRENSILSAGQMKKEIDLGDLPGGIYYMRIEGRDTALTKKFVIQK